MTKALLLGLALSAVACSGGSVTPAGTAGADGSAASGGAAAGTGGATGSGATAGSGGGSAAGAATGSGGAASCPTAAFNTAPLECLQDWTNAKLKYRSTCRVALGGYQASCGKYDATIVESATTETLCFYDRGTGNLIGATTSRGAQKTCLSFDFGFEAVDVAQCSPVTSGACGRDSGAP
jgi:hypothetical protein